MTNQPSARPPQRPRPVTPRAADPSLPPEVGQPPGQTRVPGRPPAERQPGTAGRSARRLFWVGFLTSFLLLSAASCGGLVLSTGLNRLDLASLQGGEPAWTPPIVTPTPTPDPAITGANVGQGTEGLFAIGQQVRNVTSSRVRIRQTPGHLGKSDSDILAQIAPGEAVAVIGGPTATDSLVWWLIQYQTSDGRTVEGWTAEATGSGVQILGQ